MKGLRYFLDVKVCEYLVSLMFCKLQSLTDGLLKGLDYAYDLISQDPPFKVALTKLIYAERKVITYKGTGSITLLQRTAV
jgi:hypothetical protein